jgi:tetratricopeptide (TPR) repeat protein
MIINLAAFHLFKRQYKILAFVILALVTFAVYSQIDTLEFKNYDTDYYVYENSHVKAGLTWKNIRWAFTTTYFGNWIPLTWLSHMLDVQLFGLAASRHYLTNVIFHVANTLLLFWVLRRMTGGFWRSLLVGALFALHPLHVESVAWIAERKDVLSTFWGLLSLWCYIGYSQRPKLGRFLPVFLFFILGLMTKPMLVTLPFLLLLLDYWPLKRIQLEALETNDNSANSIGFKSLLIVEKTPLFMASAVSCIVTFYAQQNGGAIGSLASFPVHNRISNALLSYVGYIAKMLWPSNLAVIYPYPEFFSIWMILASGLSIAAITYISLKFAKIRPWLLVGWLWYLGTLVPVIGLVQVGLQAMADRYTYFPIIGLFIIIAWGASDIAAKWCYGKPVSILLAFAILIYCIIGTRFQLQHWRNSTTLFEHALAVTKNNYVAQNNLGNALAKEGDLPKAISHYRESIRLKPDYARAHNNLGIALAKQGKIKDAIKQYSAAIRFNPFYAQAYNNLGAALTEQGQANEAIQYYNRALELKPDYAEAHNNLGVALKKQGQIPEAAEHYYKALRLDPNYAAPHYNLGLAFFQFGKVKKAIYHFQRALQINPAYRDVRKSLKIAESFQNRPKPEKVPIQGTM